MQCIDSKTKYDDIYDQLIVRIKDVRTYKMQIYIYMDGAIKSKYLKDLTAKCYQ